MTDKRSPIDWQAMLQLTSNKPELAKEMVTMFTAELPILRDKINTAYHSQDNETLKNEVHRLHGSCCYCGAKHLQQLAYELEEALKANNSKPIAALLDAINTEIQLIVTTIKQDIITHE